MLIFGATTAARTTKTRQPAHTAHQDQNTTPHLTTAVQPLQRQSLAAITDQTNGEISVGDDRCAVADIGAVG